MYLLIILLPLLGTIFSGLYGYKIGTYGATRITVFCITMSFLYSCIAFYEVALAGSPCYIEFFKWFDSELITFSWGFLFDSLTVVMLVVVTSISMCVHLYSTEYMANDPHIQRFMSYLSLFTFFMLILVTADNFFQMFLGWEGVGLCSYLLVNFWYGRLQANKAALKAMIVNRIGDIALALGIFLIYYIFKTIDYSTIFALAPKIHNYSLNFLGFELNGITLICIFFIAATGKSAQIGLHTGLPDAMEGPTPVSALIHAATMVTAGVFLVVRCSPLFEYAPTASLIITVSGAMTAFMAATIGLVQNDLKRVIAYSTCSQLGYMMVACGTSGYNVGMFHLTNHAFFKALLFLSAGSIIHALADEQDMRKMGGLLNLLPFTYSMMLIGSLSLMGFPFLTGFYSKDLILEWTYSQFSINGLFGYWLGAISAFFTAFYSLRVICLTFLRKPSVSKVILTAIHEAPLRMAAPLLFLSFFSIFIGYFFKDMFVGLGTDFWGTSIFILPKNILLLEAEFLPTTVKLFPVFLSTLGAGSAYILYNFYFKNIYLLKISTVGRFFYIFLNRKWFFDKIYNYFLAQNIIIWGYSHAYQNIDRGIIELLGPTGLWNFINIFSNSTKEYYNKKIIFKTKIPTLYIIIFSILFSILTLSLLYLIQINYFSYIFSHISDIFLAICGEYNAYFFKYILNEKYTEIKSFDVLKTSYQEFFSPFTSYLENFPEKKKLYTWTQFGKILIPTSIPDSEMPFITELAKKFPSNPELEQILITKIASCRIFMDGSTSCYATLGLENMSLVKLEKNKLYGNAHLADLIINRYDSLLKELRQVIEEQKCETCAINNILFSPWYNLDHKNPFVDFGEITKHDVITDITKKVGISRQDKKLGYEQANFFVLRDILDNIVNPILCTKILSPIVEVESESLKRQEYILDIILNNYNFFRYQQLPISPFETIKRIIFWKWIKDDDL